uniref:Uncharacterized protein n=1 Tax=Mycena chlorophos TaxID=658473 RepID=A0ABQ0LIP5_MYCCL|nr:predicted protein [Mycena chlorophos]
MFIPDPTSVPRIARVIRKVKLAKAGNNGIRGRIKASADHLEQGSPLTLIFLRHKTVARDAQCLQLGKEDHIV